MPDRVRPMKLESPAEGGSDIDNCLTELNVGQDYLDAAGLCVQKVGANTLTADALVRCERTSADALHFVDKVANGTTGLDLSQLLSSVSGSAGAFNALQDIRLWVPGPGDGFATGAVQVVAYVALSPLVASETWYTNAAMTVPLYSCTYTYAANSPLPSSLTYRLYKAGTLVRTAVDTLTYAANSPLETSRTRTWS
ncbi:MAG: hypothetical protein EOO40_00300 [Deltaproteobacteria bacterium]|nr:MAG: hypothetical protein EOO40_00300 [Deltaproteobacteria bacterium]